MKQYRDYKKLFSTIVLIIFLITPLGFSHGETAKEIRDKIDQKSADIAKLEEQLKIYQSELDSLGKQKNSLSVSIQQLDLTKKKLNTDISVTQNKIDKTNLKIQGLSSDIGDKEGSILNNKNSIALELLKTN